MAEISAFPKGSFPVNTWPVFTWPIAVTLVPFDYAEIWYSQVRMNREVNAQVRMNREVNDSYSELEKT